MQHYGLYIKTTYCHYSDDGGGSTSYEDIIGTDESQEQLVKRWNAAQDAKRAKLEADGMHISYIREVPPNFIDDKFKLDYYGNNGGGYSGVTHRLEIKLIPQFDEQEKAKKANS